MPILLTVATPGGNGKAKGSLEVAFSRHLDSAEN